MHYVDEGEGRPVVMVHGNPTWGYLSYPLLLVQGRATRGIVTKVTI